MAPGSNPIEGSVAVEGTALLRSGPDGSLPTNGLPRRPVPLSR
jgi:hypothetical protein